MLEKGPWPVATQRKVMDRVRNTSPRMAIMVAKRPGSHTSRASPGAACPPATTPRRASRLILPAYHR